MRIKNLDTIEAIEAFLQGNQSVAFSVFGNKDGALQWLGCCFTILLTIIMASMPKAHYSQ